MSIYQERRTYKPAAMDPDRLVPRETVAALLDDARWAPTHGLTQPWRFHVFSSSAARARLAAGLTAIHDSITPPERHDPTKRAKLAAAPLRTPVVIALLARLRPGGQIPEWEEIAAVACAAQNLMLSAHGKGLGSFWSTPPAACCPAFTAWLGAAPDHRALGLIYLGHPLAGTAVPTSIRTPLEDHMVWHDDATD